MVEVRQTERFVRWLAGLRDLRGRAKVLARIERLIGGNPGDVKPVGPACRSCGSTTALDTGLLPEEGTALIILLAGGDKSSQAKDIDEALLLADNLRRRPDENYDQPVRRCRASPNTGDMAAYLEACIEEADGDAVFIAKALGDIARAQG